MKKSLMWLCVPLLVCAGFAQTASERLIEEALKPSTLEQNLQQLTDTIGGRVPGTPAMQKALEWGEAAFKAAGADSVHSEKFTMPVSWAEGATQMTVVAPEKFSTRVVSVGWAPALPPQKRLPVVDVGGGTAKEFAKAGDLTNALLLVHSEEMKTWDDLFAEYMDDPGIIDRAVRGGATAIAFQSSRPRDLMYRHTNSGEGEIDRIAMVIVAREDADRMGRLIASGQKLYADLDIPNRVGGPISTANVVGEIKGSEKPDEYVVLGAHLDSWELGTGALDNGCNSALVVDAMRAIKATGLKPRRSIRFILFSGEEEGLLGSWAYVRAHRAEMDKVAGVLIYDAGSGRTTGFSVGGRKDLVDPVSQIVAPLKRFEATTLTTDMQSGTDHFDFMLEGVPTLVANQEEANYLINYHAMSDTYDKVDMAQLKKHVAEAAAISFALADAPERIGPRIHRAQIEQAMQETKLDEQMKQMGTWKTWTSGKRGRAD